MCLKKGSNSRGTRSCFSKSSCWKVRFILPTSSLSLIFRHGSWPNYKWRVTQNKYLVKTQWAYKIMTRDRRGGPFLDCHGHLPKRSELFRENRPRLEVAGLNWVYTVIKSWLYLHHSAWHTVGRDHSRACRRFCCWVQFPSQSWKVLYPDGESQPREYPESPVKYAFPDEVLSTGKIYLKSENQTDTGRGLPRGWARLSSASDLPTRLITM